MAGRTDADYGLVPVKSRVSLSSRPVPPFYNKGNESNLSKQDLSYLFLRHCKLRDKSVFEKKLSGETNTDYKDITDFISPIASATLWISMKRSKINIYS